ncbi:hypothetical protein [Halovenus sp. HT40]|uniref:hypothetical protein n=1 Tax=Halovenus sp. HT40 TaxID=3126691 RepID=UPI00300F56F2
MVRFREPVRTPSFEATALPTALLVLFVLASIISGWTLPDAGVVPLAVGLLFGSLYTIFAYFTTAPEYLPTPNKWVTIGVKVGIVVLIVWADNVFSDEFLLSDWVVPAFVVGLLTALTASHWWLLSRLSPQNHDQSQPH